MEGGEAEEVVELLSSEDEGEPEVSGRRARFADTFAPGELDGSCGAQGSNSCLRGIAQVWRLCSDWPIV